MKVSAFFLIAGIAMAGALSGCHTTMDARWATTHDTVNRWEAAGPNLPVEIRGELPNVSNEQIARAIPHGMSKTSPPGDSSAKFVVELGTKVSPESNAYCVGQNTQPVAPSAMAPMTVTLSLCDGARLVARSSSPLDPGDAAVDHLDRKINHLKNLMFIGLAQSRADSIDTQG
jgi:hypothetical protein